MTEIVSAEIAEGIEAIKNSNRCNMNDAATVHLIAFEMKYLELAEMIASDEDKYRRCLAHGCAVQEEVEVDTVKDAQPKKASKKTK